MKKVLIFAQDYKTAARTAIAADLPDDSWGFVSDLDDLLVVDADTPIVFGYFEGMTTKQKDILVEIQNRFTNIVYEFYTNRGRNMDEGKIDTDHLDDIEWFWPGS